MDHKHPKNDTLNDTPVKKETSSISKPIRDESNKKDKIDESSGLHDKAVKVGIVGKKDNFDAPFPGSEFDSCEIDEIGEIIPPSENQQKGKLNKNLRHKKREFNPWRELDKASRKKVSRRDLITGLFSFLPRKKDT